MTVTDTLQISTAESTSTLSGPNTVRPKNVNIFDYVLDYSTGLETRHLADEAVLQWLLSDSESIFACFGNTQLGIENEAVSSNIHLSNPTGGTEHRVFEKKLQAMRLENGGSVPRKQLKAMCLANIGSVRGIEGRGLKRKHSNISNALTNPAVSQHGKKEPQLLRMLLSKQKPEMPIFSGLVPNPVSQTIKVGQWKIEPVEYCEADRTEIKICEQVCPICKTEFPTGAELRAHLVRVHIFQPSSDSRGAAGDDILSKKCEYKCKHCEKGFRDNKAFIVHKSLKNKLHCHRCNGEFVCDGSLVAHYTLMHLKDYPVHNPICEICNKSIGSKHGLAVHYLTHLKEKIYVCQLCDKQLKTSAGLYNHIDSSHILVK